PGYRRLRYLRYADDHLLGFTGPKAEAQQIKQRLAVFLRDDLKLELSPSKTLITHARSDAARFLGYEITIQSDNRQLTKGRRAVNGQTKLRVPKDVIKAKCGPFLTRGRPARQNPMIRESDYLIVASFGARYRGIVQYYLLAGDVHRLHRLRWVMETSMLHTLAAKHRSTVSKMARKFKAKIVTPHGLRTCFEARFDREGRPPLVARFAGIPLKRQKMAVLTDREPIRSYPNKELISRLLANRCELCQRTDTVQVHHVRKLADLDMTGNPPEWVTFMANKRRKSLVVCDECHEQIHHRRGSVPIPL
ncbi:MAG: group II intron reverse transcriptase/maturase, partial [Dermatophilaceae bacterium]